jgi:hypothetical protein
VAVTAPPGIHHIVFRYTGFGGYPGLLALAVLDLLAVAIATRPGQRRVAAGRAGAPRYAQHVQTKGEE